jgi:hypothetical protein
MEHENESYTGTLFFDDADSCRQVANLLQRHIGRSIDEIGNLDVSFTA